MKQIRDKVGGLDVHRDNVVACTRVKMPDGSVEVEKQRFATTQQGLAALTGFLIEAGVTTVAMEATGVYWKPVYFALEGLFQELWLCNAAHVKNVPERKTDAVWLAKLNERGMLRPSFVPPKEIRELRDCTRLRLDLTEERSRHKQRIEKLLEDALIKVSSVATDIFGKSGRSMIEALVAGECDPDVLADLALGKMRPKRAALREALKGQFDTHHAELIKMPLAQVDALSAQIDTLTVRIDVLIGALPGPTGVDVASGGSSCDPACDPAAVPVSSVERLAEIPGVGPRIAQVIVAEVGLDMGQFPTAGHLVSWAKLSPRTIQSGAKHAVAKYPIAALVCTGVGADS